MSLQDKIKDELHRMEQIWVIVRQTEPTDLVNSMVAVVKSNKIHICIDPKGFKQGNSTRVFPDDDNRRSFRRNAAGKGVFSLGRHIWLLASEVG